MLFQNTKEPKISELLSLQFPLTILVEDEVQYFFGLGTAIDKNCPNFVCYLFIEKVVDIFRKNNEVLEGHDEVFLAVVKRGVIIYFE